jgi:hypothetical protein
VTSAKRDDSTDWRHEAVRLDQFLSVEQGQVVLRVKRADDGAR